MSKENKLKVGDRVRMKRTVCFDYITFEKGCVGEVVSDETDKGTCFVQMKNAENGTIINHFICASNLELIDPKTAFLSELKGLLEKYNVCLIAHKTDMPISVYFEGEDEPCVTIGKEVNKGCGIVITADNIMDYEKE